MILRISRISLYHFTNASLLLLSLLDALMEVFIQGQGAYLVVVVRDLVVGVVVGDKTDVVVVVDNVVDELSTESTEQSDHPFSVNQGVAKLIVDVVVVDGSPTNIDDDA